LVGSEHSTNGQLCSNGIVLVTDRLNHILGLEQNEGAETVSVEPGVLLSDLTEWLDKKGRSIGYSVIGYRGVTIGGAIATAAHGSSIRHNTMMSSLIASITLVTADGKMTEFSEKNTDAETFRALRANLGMLGAVVNIRLHVQPQFNLHVQVTSHSDSALFEKGGVIKQVSSCDFGQLLWFPHVHSFLRTCGNETQEVAEANASNTLLSPPIPSFILKPYSLVLQYGTCSHSLNVLLEDLRYLSLRILPPFEKKKAVGGILPASDVIGPSHQMLSSSDNQEGVNMFITDWEIAIPISSAEAALRDLKKLILNSDTALPVTGLFMRFSPADDATLLGHTTVGADLGKNEPVMLVEFPTFRPLGYSHDQMDKYNLNYRNMLGLLIEKYHGRAHLGKNEDWVFKREFQLKTYGDRLQRFQNVMHSLDPRGVFKNSFGELIFP
jgi:FAD/FMN-containing dehydrogenase